VLNNDHFLVWFRCYWSTVYFPWFRCYWSTVYFPWFRWYWSTVLQCISPGLDVIGLQCYSVFPLASHFVCLSFMASVECTLVYKVRILNCLSLIKNNLDIWGSYFIWLNWIQVDYCYPECQLMISSNYRSLCHTCMINDLIITSITQSSNTAAHTLLVNINWQFILLFSPCYVQILLSYAVLYILNNHDC
jgi:hypothetical protein